MKKIQENDDLRGQIEEIDLRFELYERASQVYRLLQRRKSVYTNQGLVVYAPELSKLISWADKLSKRRGASLSLRIMGVLLRRLERRIIKLENLQAKKGTFSSVSLRLRRRLSIRKGTPTQFEEDIYLFDELGRYLKEPDQEGTK